MTNPKDALEWYERKRVEARAMADRPKNMIHIDEVYRLIAGHSNYHGDSILSAFTCLVEGKDVKPIAPLDESADRPTGEWIKSDILPNGWHCRHCDAPVMTDDIKEMLFCPNCGSYNGGVRKNE